MRTKQEPSYVTHVDGKHETHAARTQDSRKKLMRLTWIHVGVFVVSFIFTTGIATLSVLLWIRPESLLAVVVVSIFLSLVFVSTFAALRMLVLYRLFDEYQDDEDSSAEHRLAKSVTYGFVSLAAAFILMAFLINISVS